MASSQWRFADFRLDPDNACLWRGTQPIALTPKAFDVLHFLVTHPDRLVTKDTLLDAVWPETAVSDAVVRIAIGELRRALGDTAQASRYIATVQRRGYRFVAPVVEHTEEVPGPARPDHHAPVVPPLAALPAPEAERRRLTVLFCDLIDSTRLAGHLDPEDLREVVRAYHQTCAAVIHQYDGYIAQYLGDGLLVYFGYPLAHEDDAQRAVRTGLGILRAMDPLNARLTLSPGNRLAVRLGIHTGLVVIGEVGAGPRQEPLALGETPNLAARLQGLAAPNTLVVSAATWQLLGGFFAGQALGPMRLHGRAQPLEVYQVLAETTARSRLEAAGRTGLTPLVGREQEVGLLRERWAQAKSGHGQVILLTGEAGIGKSRLVQTLKEHVANELHLLWECRSLAYCENTALFPLTDLFQRLLRFEAEESPDAKFDKLEYALSQYRLPVEDTVPLFAPFLALPVPEHRYPLLNLSPQRQRQKTLETLVAILLELAEHQPVLFILEDLHWTDPTTLEWLHLLIDQTPTASILVLFTCRPHFQPTWHHRSYLTEITVNRLAQPQIEPMITQVAGGKALPHVVMQQIVERTDGVPLFVEELTKAILESGQLKALDEHYELTGAFSTSAIPATLQDSLMARLDRLVSAKGIAQLAAVIGRQFSYELLQAISQLDAMMLQRELERLVEVELVYQRGLPPQATYVFKHALIQDAAYQSLLKSTKQGYHQRIAQVLEFQFPETVEAQPELLAHHYSEAGLTEKAVHYWYHAGQCAAERSAHVEAISHLTKGLELLKTLPETPQRLPREVDMLIALGTSLIATKGWAVPEVEETYLRAQHLCQHLENPHQLFPVLWGLWAYALVRAEYQIAHTLGKQLLTLAQQAQDSTMLLVAHAVLGRTLFWLGAGASAHRHFAQGIALYDPQQHRAYALLYGEDAGVVCHSGAAWALWLLGYPDQGLTRSQETVTLAQQLAHPFSLVYALSAAARFHLFRREERCTQECAAAVLSLAQEQGFAQWMALGAILHGWALLAHQEQAQEGIAQLSDGLRALQATGAAIARPYFLALLAEAHGIMGQPEAGLTMLTEALALVDATGERWYESEMYRLKGALLLQQNSANQAEAENFFHHALAIARTQQAKSFELRTATSLAKLWQQQGKRQEAHDLLAPVYHWFTEGFDTADLQEAKALLDALV